jgi:hypothetical protein
LIQIVIDEWRPVLSEHQTAPLEPLSLLQVPHCHQQEQHRARQQPMALMPDSQSQPLA